MVFKWSKEDLEEAFSGLEDPRLDRTKKYSLNEILFLVLVGALTGVESWRGIEIAGLERLVFLRKYFPYEHGIPSHQTIARVFSLFKPKEFELFFSVFSRAICDDEKPKFIALDGKTLRGSFDKALGQKPLHVLNAFAVDNGLCIGQIPVDEKSNEITAVPAMLDLIDVEGATISVDALNTQKDIAAKIIDSKADYTLALKGNHKFLSEKANYIFDTRYYVKECYECRDVEKSHGRITERHYQVIALDEQIFPDILQWKGLVAIGRCTSETIRNDKKTSETRTYLLSYVDVERFAKSARSHWGIENQLHWTLDVTFKEDHSRKRKDHAPRNFAVVRKLALNILVSQKSSAVESPPMPRYPLHQS